MSKIYTKSLKNEHPIEEYLQNNSVSITTNENSDISADHITETVGKLFITNTNQTIEGEKTFTGNMFIDKSNTNKSLKMRNTSTGDELQLEHYGNGDANFNITKTDGSMFFRQSGASALSYNANKVSIWKELFLDNGNVFTLEGSIPAQNSTIKSDINDNLYLTSGSGTVIIDGALKLGNDDGSPATIYQDTLDRLVIDGSSNKQISLRAGGINRLNISDNGVASFSSIVSCSRINQDCFQVSGGASVDLNLVVHNDIICDGSLSIGNNDGSPAVFLQNGTDALEIQSPINKGFIFRSGNDIKLSFSGGTTWYVGGLLNCTNTSQQSFLCQGGAEVNLNLNVHGNLVVDGKIKGQSQVRYVNASETLLDTDTYVLVNSTNSVDITLKNLPNNSVFVSRVGSGGVDVLPASGKLLDLGTASKNIQQQSGGYHFVSDENGNYFTVSSA